MTSECDVSSDSAHTCGYVVVIVLAFVSLILFFFFFSSRRRHTRFDCDWSSDVCSSDLLVARGPSTYGSRRSPGRRELILRLLRPLRLLSSCGRLAARRRTRPVFPF